MLPLGLSMLVAALVVYPLGMLVFGTFWSAAPGQPGTLTLENWEAVLGDRATFDILLTSLAIAAPRTLLALLLATAFAWCIARTNVPCKRFLEGLLAFMFFLPELPWVLAWMLLGAPNVGLLNQFLGTLFSGGESLINVYSYGGLIVLGAARSAPVLFLFIHPAFLAMDSTLEEAARMSGASAWRTLWRINLPLLMPALLASGILSFVVAMESFEIPQLLGTPANIFVFTTRIYDLAYGGHVANFGAAMVLALILLALTGSLIMVQSRLLRGRAYTTVSGRGFKARPMDLGSGRWIAFVAMLIFFVIFGALPFVVLLLNSFMELSGFISWDMLTTKHWSNALGRGEVLRSIADTLMVGTMAATVGVIASVFISYVVTRTSWGGRKALDMMAWGPWAVPGLVMSLGFLWAFVWLPIYGTLWVVVLALVARGLPVASRFFTTTMVQLSAELEELARIHGASWSRTFLRNLVAPVAPCRGRRVDSPLRYCGPSIRRRRAAGWSGSAHVVDRHLPLDGDWSTGGCFGFGSDADRARHRRVCRGPPPCSPSVAAISALSRCRGSGPVTKALRCEPCRSVVPARLETTSRYSY